MKNLFKFALITILITLCTSCSKDEETFIPSASDINSTIDENPSTGTTIGTVATNLTGTLNYNIVSESITNAFSVNSSGVITVKDALAFDYEATTSLTATVSVTNSSETATSKVSVSLNDVDDIMSFLSTSRSAYEAATNNSWIQITSEEYNSLALSLNQVFRSGTTEEEYNHSNTTQNSGGGLYTITNSQQPPIPTGSIVFAFRYRTTTGGSISGNKVKLSNTSNNSGFEDLGNMLYHLDFKNTVICI